MENLEFSELKLPWMRNELIHYLHNLADEVYQYQAWVEDSRPEGGHDELDYIIHFLYDDTDLANNPSSLIGWILKGEKEVNVIVDLINSLNYLFEKYGTELTDKEYLEKAEWKNIIQAAKTAEITIIHG